MVQKNVGKIRKGWDKSKLLEIVMKNWRMMKMEERVGVRQGIKFTQMLAKRQPYSPTKTN